MFAYVHVPGNPEDNLTYEFGNGKGSVVVKHDERSGGRKGHFLQRAPDFDQTK